MAKGIRVLAFSANSLKRPLDLDSELRAIQHALGDTAHVTYLPAARPQELVSDVSASNPVIVHFMGHGAPDGIQMVVGPNDQQPASGDVLREMFAGRGVRLVVLSCCYSAAQAHQIARSVSAVVGTSGPLEDESGAMFAAAFYQALKRGATVDDALRDGRVALRLQHATDTFEIVGDRTWRLVDPPAPPRSSLRDRPRTIAASLVGIVVVAVLGIVAIATGSLGGGQAASTAGRAAASSPSATSRSAPVALRTTRSPLAASPAVSTNPLSATPDTDTEPGTGGVRTDTDSVRDRVPTPSTSESAASVITAPPGAPTATRSTNTPATGAPLPSASTTASTRAAPTAVTTTRTPTTVITTAAASSTNPPPTPGSVAQLAAANGAARLAELVALATSACDSYGPGDHGSTVTIAGIGHQIVWAEAHATQRGLEQNDRGGYTALVTGPGPFLILGSDGGDNLTSHQASDVICGRDGDDVINAKDGNDLMVGGAGADTLKATAGTNVLVGDSSDTELSGGADVDWCSDVANAFSPCEHRF